ncbi:MAG: lytic murein transglycosylase [Alphaproteobacteria bacterium]
MNLLPVFTLGAALLLCPLSLQAAENNSWPESSSASIATPIENEAAGFNGFIKQAQRMAASEGIGARGLNALANAQFLPRVIELDRKQPENKITFAEYWDNVSLPERIAKGKKLKNLYAKELAILQQRYGVSAGVVMALWAMETNFSHNMGKFLVVDSLATLAYEGRRKEFFSKELIAALKIIDRRGGVLKGSWAGAMGGCQFMPSSYLNFAKAWNNTATADIWGNPRDVLTSAAHYLAAHGWQKGQKWGMEVKLPAHYNPAMVGKSNSMKTWGLVGIKRKNGQALPNSAETPTLVIPDDSSGRAFLVNENYNVIKKWNKSSYFALSIGLLADQFGAI